jgi:N-acetylmuramoyl-L-alanine amidase
MDTPQTPVPEKDYTTPSAWGNLHHIQVVIIVAALLATLFTAWTDVGLLPDSLTQRLSQEMPAAIEEMSESELPTSSPQNQQRIGIVAGHWGNDSGAVCPDGLTEVDINLEIATRVKESLAGYGYEVDLLKEFDPRLIGYKAMVLVSIHADSCDYLNDFATGFKVSAAASTFYPEQATRLTGCMTNRYASVTELPYHAGSVTSDMTSYHAFGEIHHDTTAAIIETGFMNLDRQILTEQPDLIARGVVNGILCFVRNEDLSDPDPSETTPAEP